MSLRAALDAIDLRAQKLDARHWQPLMLRLDRYTRQGRHQDRPGAVSGRALVAAHRPLTEEWGHVFATRGIRAAIELNLGAVAVEV